MKNNNSLKRKSIIIIVIAIALCLILVLVYKYLDINHLLEKNIDNPELKDEVASIIYKKYNVTIDKSKLKIIDYIPAHSEEQNQCTFDICMEDVTVSRYAKFRYEDKIFTLVGDSEDFFNYEVLNNTKEHYAKVFNINKEDIYIAGKLDNYEDNKRCTQIYSDHAEEFYIPDGNTNYLNLYYSWSDKSTVQYDSIYTDIGMYIKLDNNNLEEKIKSIIDTIKQDGFLDMNITILKKNSNVKETNYTYDKYRHDFYCVNFKNENVIAEVKDWITTDTDSNYKKYNNYYYKIY